jgi:hypothetical protein
MIADGAARAAFSRRLEFQAAGLEGFLNNGLLCIGQLEHRRSHSTSNLAE